MVFAAVGMTDGTRICPGGHWKQETGLDHGFLLFFFSQKFCRPCSLSQKVEVFLKHSQLREASLHVLLCHWWNSWCFFCRKTCARPKKQQVWHWPLTRVWKFFVLASLEYPLVVRDIREENTPSWVCIKTPSMEEAHYPPAFLSWCCRCCWIFQKPSVWVCCCGVCTRKLCENITLVDHAQQQVNTWKKRWKLTCAWLFAVYRGWNATVF